MMQGSAKSEAVPIQDFSRFQTTVLVLLRIVIGWHFFYEGLAKLFNPYWTSAGLLAESKWWFSGLFMSLASSPSILAVVDFLNIWGLILVGLGLMLGCFARVATIAAIVMLALYYIAAPPFVGYVYSMPAEGSYLIVNKVLVELFAVLALLAFPTSYSFGLDRLIFWRRSPEYRALTQAQAVGGK